MALCKATPRHRHPPTSHSLCYSLRSLWYLLSDHLRMQVHLNAHQMEFWNVIQLENIMIAHAGTDWCTNLLIELCPLSELLRLSTEPPDLSLGFSSESVSVQGDWSDSGSLLGLNWVEQREKRMIKQLPVGGSQHIQMDRVVHDKAHTKGLNAAEKNPQ